MPDSDLGKRLAILSEAIKVSLQRLITSARLAAIYRRRLCSGDRRKADQQTTRQ